MANRNGITQYAWLSIITAVFIIILKLAAFQLTQSIGFLSDAVESIVNIVAAVVTLLALTIASRPPDQEHPFGHSKAEYLSAGIEGFLILIAALYIIYQAVLRFITPAPLENVGYGVLVSVIASAANFGVAQIILKAGKQHRSAALIADGQHLLTDVWTSIGVIVSVGVIGLTGWLWLDPIIALVVALNIMVIAGRLLRTSVDGLMDVSLPPDELEIIEEIIQRYAANGVSFHALRTREAGSQRFVSFHIQVPGAWSITQGHELLESIEHDIRQALNPVTVMTHIEPVEDPASWADASLWRDD